MIFDKISGRTMNDASEIMASVMMPELIWLNSRLTSRTIKYAKKPMARPVVMEYVSGIMKTMRKTAMAIALSLKSTLASSENMRTPTITRMG